MAGAGYKLFNTGDVLTAAQVNTYLQEQVVMVFANAAARTTALSGVLAEGMVSYLKDTDALEIYSGAAWVGYGSGDITGITTGATSGLTGGVTSGTADLKLNTTAKGGLLVGTGSGTSSELAVGTNGQILTADSTTATGLKWAAAAGGGKVLQVIQDTLVNEITTTSATLADTGLEVSITPSSVSSKVLIIANVNGVGKTSASDTAVKLRLLRGSTTLVNTERNQYSGQTGLSVGAVTFAYLDSPATTSATTYKIQYASLQSGSTSTINTYQGTNDSTSAIIVFEIGA